MIEVEDAVTAIRELRAGTGQESVSVQTFLEHFGGHQSEASDVLVELATEGRVFLVHDKEASPEAAIVMLGEVAAHTIFLRR